MAVQHRFSERADGDFAITAEPRALAAARSALAPHPWTWLEQVHGAGVVVVSRPGQWASARADAAVTSTPGAVLAVQTADCAPVLFTAVGPGPSAGPVIGAAHAGWKGLYEGVLEATVGALVDVAEALLSACQVAGAASGAAASEDCQDGKQVTITAPKAMARA